ncbi:MAG TPA: phosphatidate cytidylyltransferase [Bradyrhizobium sp.]|nr:phosphatidate cytidylyltransferase [Bradyrhizobium sp.]
MSEHEAAPAAVAGQDSRNLLMRVAAALVMAPVAIGAAYAGGWWWITLVTLATIGLYIEWLTVVGAARRKAVVIAGIGALALSGLGLALDKIDASLLMLAIGLASVAVLSRQPRRWTVAGFLYAAIALLASVVVRLDQAQGLAALILVLLVVWATDIGGYFAGRAVGGPKLWPRVSPKKTWAGALGGFAASLVVAAGFATFGFGRIWPMLLLAAVLSIASQFGDLFESAVKRRFGVKDSSHIIPGHGGLLDRLDGFVAAIALAAIFGFLRGGVDGVGRALMVW